MIANIITIGDEILVGQIVDTNSAWIADELAKIGVTVTRIISITDDIDDIVNTLDKSISRSDLVILTGGLGPTRDDKTKSALSKYFETPLIRDEATIEKLTDILSKRGIPISEINKLQADLPEKCTVLDNRAGIVPGIMFNENGKIVVAAPGVPSEMKYIIGEEFIPYLKEHFQLPPKVIKTFLTVGVAESVLAERLEEFEDNLPKDYSLAYLPSPGKVRLRLSTTGRVGDNVDMGFEKMEQKLTHLLGNTLFGYNKDSLESVIGKLLSENNFTVSTAESCSGGEIANAITGIPGASKYFKGTVVSYSNTVKEEVLNVSKVDLETLGAVSEQVALQMAENVKKIMKSDFSAATSGIAGPTGGTDEKPVGTVWIAISSPRGTFAKLFHLGNNRERVTQITATYALNLLRLEILELLNTK